MSRDNFINCGDLMMKTFSSIVEGSKKSGELSEVWKKILLSIKHTGMNSENTGRNMYEHSSLIEIKNGILLVETDHPGWIQIFNMHKKYILNGFRMYAKQLNITSLAFRLKGSNAQLVSVDYDKALKSENIKENRKIEQEEKETEKYEKRASEKTENEPKNELPEELLSRFESIKQSMLTKK